ncbi:protein of unknown function [Beijerinckiaceae bacterium RH AL1]|nr:protein of unknown function [Beijerinckiaceae bacterium RH CH11]VVB49323.1 protein of unknown function [Beijerinckiaceae bacterium RH AL8]VVC56801.1 protein of unknown function [Beijerinckiaceae bacterium RH AL1]
MDLRGILTGLVTFIGCVTTANADVYRTICGDDDAKVRFSIESDTNSKIGVLVDYDWNTKAAPGRSKSKISLLKVTSVGWYHPLVRVGLVDLKTRYRYTVEYFEPNVPAKDGYSRGVEDAAVTQPDDSTSKFSCALNE